MKTKRIRYWLSSLLLTAASVQAAPPSGPAAMAHACATLVQAETGVNRYEVVRKITRSGRDSYIFWINGTESDIGAYCITQSSEVVATYISNAWRKSRTFHPQPQQLTLAAAD